MSFPNVRTDGTSSVARRSLLKRGAALTGAAVSAASGSQVLAAPAARAESAPPAGAYESITRADPRYLLLTTGNNQRFVAAPEHVALPTTSAQVAAALQDAVDRGQRVTVRSGGHCFADFVCHKDVEAIIDLSRMKGVGYDEERRAFWVEPGARLLDVYDTLYRGWNVTVPGGICYSVGAGGHFTGGGYGLLSRTHGLVIDHLYGVEVVTADADGRVHTTLATREADDPHRDLWWAHAGGGGGNFGIVTRYWLRSEGATGTDPTQQLANPPTRVLVCAWDIPWQSLDEGSFIRLVKNWGAWHEQNSSPTSPARHLSSLFNVSARAHGSLGIFTQLDADVPGARDIMDGFLNDLLAGTGITRGNSLTRANGELPAMPGLETPRTLPWLQATRLVGTNNPTITDPAARGAHKSAYMRRNFDDLQLAHVYRMMSDENFTNPDTMLVLFSYGGAVNARSSSETASAQRDSIFKMCFQTFWHESGEDETYLTWLREIYEGFFAGSGGAPQIAGQSDGCYINYPDSDMADVTRNRSGIPWQRLYYKDNYPRLQQVKKQWDPQNRFRHSLSIEPAR